jgi:hypothetical protein
MKYNCVIMLKGILKHNNQCLNDAVTEWIITNAFQGSKNDYWEILSITTNLSFYYLFRTDKSINYNKFRKWFFKKPSYIESNDETIKNLYCQ